GAVSENIPRAVVRNNNAHVRMRQLCPLSLAGGRRSSVWAHFLQNKFDVAALFLCDAGLGMNFGTSVVSCRRKETMERSTREYQPRLRSTANRKQSHENTSRSLRLFTRHPIKTAEPTHNKSITITPSPPGTGTVRHA